MKHTLAAAAIAATLILVGCDSSGSTRTYTAETPVEKAGTSITLTTGGDGNLEYSHATDGSIIVGSGNGDINIVQGDGYITNTNAVPETDGSFVTTGGEPTCGGGVAGECPDGFFWCPIENKCLPA